MQRRADHPPPRSPTSLRTHTHTGDASNCTLKASVPDPAGGKPKKWELKLPARDHTQALENILDFISANVSPGFAGDVAAVGHRIVHGLDISKPVLLDARALAKIQEASVFAPLHNPAGLQGIQAAQQVFEGVPQVRPADAESVRCAPGGATRRAAHPRA